MKPPTIGSRNNGQKRGRTMSTSGNDNFYFPVPIKLPPGNIKPAAGQLLPRNRSKKSVLPKRISPPQHIDISDRFNTLPTAHSNFRESLYQGSTGPFLNSS